MALDVLSIFKQSILRFFLRCHLSLPVAILLQLYATRFAKTSLDFLIAKIIMKHLLIAALLVGSAAAFRVDSANLNAYSFEAFTKDFEKTYATAEERASREAIFNANLKMINAHNANPNKGFEMSVNHMADFTEAEFKAVIGFIPASRRGLKPFLKNLQTTTETTTKRATSIDWRQKGVVTPVKNQGGCGSCWAFSSTENMESHWALATNQLLELSTQQVTSCTPNPRECGGTGGCRGATSELGYEYAIAAGGLVLEKDFPYRGIDSNCAQLPNRAPRVANFSSYVAVPTNDQDAVLEALNVGPLTIGVWATPMQFYNRGIFNGCSYDKNMAINHAVQLVGYGTEAGKDYWIVRNSWGGNWGENGYIRLQRDAVAQCGMDSSPKDGSACKDDPDTPLKVCGQCGILYETSYPIAKL